MLNCYHNHLTNSCIEPINLGFKMRITILMLLFVSVFACSEEQKIAEEVIQESQQQNSLQDWDKVKTSSQQALQDLWDVSKEESTELWEHGKETSKEVWQSSKDKSTELWEQGKENSKEVWDEFESDSQKAWSEGKTNLQELLEKEEDLTNQIDEI